MALSMVPLADIDYAWRIVECDMPGINHERYRELNSFKTYFVTTWLAGRTIMRHHWNHFGLVISTHSTLCTFQHSFYPCHY